MLLPIETMIDVLLTPPYSDRDTELRSKATARLMATGVIETLEAFEKSEAKRGETTPAHLVGALTRVMSLYFANILLRISNDGTEMEAARLFGDSLKEALMREMASTLEIVNATMHQMKEDLAKAPPNVQRALDEVGGLDKTKAISLINMISSRENTGIVRMENMSPEEREAAGLSPEEEKAGFAVRTIDKATGKFKPRAPTA